MTATKRPAPWPAIAIMLALLITAAVLNAWAERVGPSWPATPQTTEAATEPAKTAQSSESAQVSIPSPKFHYYSREPVTGAYITTTGTPTALTDGWATTPTTNQRMGTIHRPRNTPSARPHRLRSLTTKPHQPTKGAQP